MKIMKTAWKNLWRNRGRTILSATAIAVSSFIVMFVIGFEEGFIGDMTNNLTANVTGDIRIMRREYVENDRVSPLQFYIENTEELIAAAESNPLVEFATARTEFGVSLYRDGKQIPSRAVGVDMNRSKLVNGRNSLVEAGTLPAPGKNEILIATGFARETGIKPGDRVTLLTKTASSGTNGRTFTVSGVLSVADASYRNRAIFLDIERAGDFLRMGRDALQIQVFLKNGPTINMEDAAKDVSRTLTAAAGADFEKDYDLRPWYAVSSTFSFFKLASVMYFFIGAIFYFLAGTVIINTTMMSVLERRKEIGTLAALGMEKIRILALFLAESLWIAVIGTLSGGAAGLAGLAALGTVGVDFQKMGGGSIDGLSASEIIYPSISAGSAALVVVLGIVVTLIACVMPARMATRVEPAEALRVQ
ncbi:FtsX-like permease family protein [Treponema zuelzerae]|uniref:FtsX-like permease family protein n=1 Tax=Teretinema zuelzerae TaxID=156 RepID=A0AAE3EF92_9SPIR|nr:FtsX-like permease family protein [Teretinema zuelzerae]MCD1653690.1 FtsX-like permease family protein [Teretinema zuelzerae]